MDQNKTPDQGPKDPSHPDGFKSDPNKLRELISRFSHHEDQHKKEDSREPAQSPKPAEPPPAAAPASKPPVSAKPAEAKAEPPGKPAPKPVPQEPAVQAPMPGVQEPEPPAALPPGANLNDIARAALDPGDEVLIPHPSFEPYATEAMLGGGAVVRSPLAGYRTDLDDMRRRVTPRTKVVFVCTPHNPASTIVPAGMLLRFLEGLGDDAPIVVVDEAYRDFCDDPDTPDGVALARRFPTVIDMRTFSKIAGLAGLRVGYAVARPEIIDRLNRVRAPFNVNRFAQVAAVAALDDRTHLKRTRSLILAERPRLAAALQARGAVVPPSQANFLLVRVGEQAGPLRQALMKAGILVRDGAGVGFPGHLRIAIGTAEQNNRLLEVWTRTLAR